MTCDTWLQGFSVPIFSGLVCWVFEGWLLLSFVNIYTGIAAVSADGSFWLQLRCEPLYINILMPQRLFRAIAKLQLYIDPEDEPALEPVSNYWVVKVSADGSFWHQFRRQMQPGHHSEQHHSSCRWQYHCHLLHNGRHWTSQHFSDCHSWLRCHSCGRA